MSLQSIKGVIMNKKRFFAIILLLGLLLPSVLGVSKVHAAYPSFTISEVKKDATVTILTQDMPGNLDWKVLMGEYNTRAENGIEVATFNSGAGGSMSVTFNIPDTLKGRAMISIRIESLTGGYYYYNWFWNDKDNGTWPPEAPAPVPAPPKPPVSTTASEIIPIIMIKSVEAGKTVTITASNFPKNVEFVAKMNKMWTRGVNGTEVGTLNSGDTGAFEATFDIPDEFKGHERVAIRLESKTGGYYSYNWFWNVSTGTSTPAPAPTTPAPVVKYPYFNIVAVERDKTVSVDGFDFPADTEFTILMGKMWTMGINGIEVGTLNSGAGGKLSATFNIPAELAGQTQIAIRLQAKTGGWFAYNWFWNNTTAK
jgi:hypothetical protein